VDQNGEHSDVMTVEFFDPDHFLREIAKPHCPRCRVVLKWDVVKKQDGTDWEYYRCPNHRWFTKCYVTCGADEVNEYLKRVEEQTHPFYDRIDPARFRCECNKSLVLATSHSANNPNRLYLKCPKRTCQFFQWIDEPPRGLAETLLIK
jgi:hypothetical protein